MWGGINPSFAAPPRKRGRGHDPFFSLFWVSPAIAAYVLNAVASSFLPRVLDPTDYRAVRNAASVQSATE